MSKFTAWVVKVRDYILARAAETSTWTGLVLIATAFGVRINPAQAQAIAVLGVGAAGLLHALLPDKME
jgi:hypothetical protein